jgi:hypothetical protein
MAGLPPTQLLATLGAVAVGAVTTATLVGDTLITKPPGSTRSDGALVVHVEDVIAVGETQHGRARPSPGACIATSPRRFRI